MLQYHNIQDIKIKLTAMKTKSMEVEKAVADKKPEEEINFLMDELKQLAMELAKG
mgnify:FL=1|jgi:hypothetical protein|tara:strand:- start:279 stop:443 length:165 start_codon:yes stop_codon:yes gene_type:complete